MEPKPTRISEQTLSQTSCTKNCIENLLQDKIWIGNHDKSYAQFRREMMNIMETIWNDLPGMTEERMKGKMIHCFGTGSTGPEVIKPWLEGYGLKCYHIGYKDAKNIVDGWITVQFKKKNCCFSHAIAIKNKWVIDSIVLQHNENGVYPWNGTVKGYFRLGYKYEITDSYSILPMLVEETGNQEGIVIELD